MQSAKEIGWAHAANDETHLRDALANNQISMIEADIMFRSAEDVAQQEGVEGAGVPVMAHPPTIPPGAIPFEAWLDIVLDHNRQATASGRTKKGVKLDFKSFDAVGPCLALLVARHKDCPFDFPIWLNADVLPGPGGGPSLFDGQKFVEMCQQALPNAVLSLGWTTGYPTNERDMKGYTADMVDAMLALIDGHVQEGTHVTFPLQLWYAHRSWPQVERLLARQHTRTDGQRALASSVTLWGEEVTNIRQWVEATSHFRDGRIYIDLVPAAVTTARV